MPSVVFHVFRGVSAFLTIIEYIIFAYCIASWFLRPDNRLYIVLRNISQPFLAPFRPIARRMTLRWGLRLDVTPILTIFALSMINRLIWWVYQLVFPW